MHDGAQWFVLWTHSNSERLVNEQLVGKGFETFLPMLKSWSRRRGVQSSISVPMFPGYVFVRHAIDKRGYVEMLKARGVVRVLGERWDRPASVADDEIAAIRRVAAADLPVFPYPYLSQGQQVRIQHGPLTGLEGILISTKPQKGLLVVSVELLQRSVAVEVESTQVRPVPSGTAGWRRAVALALCLIAGTAASPNAQGFSIAPSAAAGIVYDGNPFYRPGAPGDTITRFSPRVDAALATERLTVSSRYSLDAERFARHPELTTAHARQDFSFEAKYGASRRLSLAADAAFADTHSPAELNDVAAVTPGRARASRLTLHPSARYTLGRRTDLGAAYTVVSETLRGGIGLTAHTAASMLEHRRSDRESVRVEYLDQHFLFTGLESTTSRTLTAEWTREVARGTSLTLRAGPRVTAGAFAPEFGASAHRLLRAGNLSLSYLRTQTTLIGLAGVARTQSVAAAVEGQVRPRVTLRAGSAVLRTRHTDLSSLVYRASASCAVAVGRRVSIEAGYDASLQRGNLYLARTAEHVRRHVASFTLAVAGSGAARSR